MYTVNQLQSQGLDYVELANASATAKAKICLNRGGALESLVLKSETIIEDLSPLEYKNTYASSVLFPFANRIKDGKYAYNNQEFQLDCNEGNLNNALHGLIYNKTFSVVNSDVTENGATVTLKYVEREKAVGFPYLYTIALKFTLTEANLVLEIEIENNDVSSFPFTLGWHPYFVCKDLSKSSLEFLSSKTVAFDDRMITSDVVAGKVEMPFEIKEQQLDNCYALDSGTVVFNTPSYKMTIESSAKENYFQMYTPPRANTIALEPVTGISDSFNNKLGLEELQAGASHSVNWSIAIN
ncbi:aldose 1-epimerase [Wenyingzhuangia heitensis]|uniref:Aldose 1-epimerase n=1 Tax=Wenyingzhuangia heitensis TaxID=1487859 RepID=A0ABX0U9G4_9FLAO|nr:aldose 1-epimerase [Wenyingzhuangia heitensis]NIJ43712.1 aldose 1-epimerase [Wenyingzhuangia heitensis]